MARPATSSDLARWRRLIVQARVAANDPDATGDDFVWAAERVSAASFPDQRNTGCFFALFCLGRDWAVRGVDGRRGAAREVQAMADQCAEIMGLPSSAALPSPRRLRADIDDID